MKSTQNVQNCRTINTKKNSILSIFSRSLSVWVRHRLLLLHLATDHLFTRLLNCSAWRFFPSPRLSPCRCTTRPSDFIIPFQSSIDFVVPCARIDFHLSFFNAWLYILISFERALSAAATVSSVWPSFDFMETLTIRQNWIDTSILLLYREHKSCM